MIIYDKLRLNIQFDYYISMSSVRHKPFQKLKRIHDDNSDSQISSQSIQRIKKQLSPRMIQQGSISSSMSEFQKQQASSARNNQLDYFELKNLVFQLRSQVNNLHIENESLSNQLSASANERSVLIQENQFFQEQIRKIKVAYQQSQRQLQVLRKKFRGQDDIDFRPFSMPSNPNNSRAKENPLQKLSLQQNTQHLLTENERLSKVANDFENQNEKLSQQLKQLHSKNLQLTTTIHTKKNMQIQQLIIKNEELIQNLKQQIKKINTQKEELKLQLKFRLACNEEMQQKIEHYRREITNKSNKLDWQSTISKQQKESTFDRTSLADLKTKQMQVFQLSIQNSKKQNLLNALEQKLALKEKQLMQQIQNQNQMKFKNQMLQKQIKQMQQVYFKQQRQLTNLSVNKDHSSNKTEMQLKSLKATIELLTEQKKYEVGERDATISKLQQKINMLQFSNANQSAIRKIQFLKKQIILLQRQNHNLKNQLQTIKEETNKPLFILKEDYQKLKLEKKNAEEMLKKQIDIFKSKLTENTESSKKLKTSENQIFLIKQKLKLQLRANDDIMAQLQQKSSKIHKQDQKIRQLEKKILKQTQLASQVNKNNRELQNKLDIVTASYEKLQRKYKKDICELDERMNQVLTENQKKSSISKSRDDSKSYSQKSYKKSIINSQPNQSIGNKQESWGKQSIKSKYSNADPNINYNPRFNFSRKNETHQKVKKPFDNKNNSQIAIHQNQFSNSDKKSYLTINENNCSNNKTLCRNDKLKVLLENVQKQLKLSQNQRKKELVSHYASETKNQSDNSHDVNMLFSYPSGKNLFANIKKQKDNQIDNQDYQSIIKKYTINPSSSNAENDDKQTDILLNQYNSFGNTGHNRKVSQGLYFDTSNVGKGKNSTWVLSRKVTTQRCNVEPPRKNRLYQVPATIQQQETMENNPSKQTFGRLKSQQSNQCIDQAIYKMKLKNDQLRNSNQNPYFFVTTNKKTQMEPYSIRNNIITFRNQSENIKNKSGEISYEKYSYSYEGQQQHNKNLLGINYK